MAKRSLLGAALGAAFGASAAQAGGWEFGASLAGRLTWTDNLRLVAEGGESAGVLEVAPAFRARRAGRRLQVRADYRLQQFLYTEGLGAAATWHQFQGSAKAELVRQTVYLDATAGYGQVLADPDGTVPVGNLSLTANRTDAASLSVSPYAVFRLGDAATGRLRYGHRRVRTGVRGADSRIDEWSARLAGPPGGRRLGWGLGWIRSEQRFTGRPDFEREVATADLSLRLTSSLSLVVSGGREDNSYQRAAGTPAPEGGFWSAGLRWTPSRRTALELRRGERFFGGTAAVKASFRTRRAVLDASYAEDLATVQRLILDRQLFVLTDPFGNPVLAGGVPVVIEISFPALTAEVFLRKRGTLAWSWRRGRSSYGLSLYDERREYQTTAETERVRGGNVSWTWRLARRTTSTLALAAQRRDRRGGAGMDDFRYATWDLSRRIRPDLSGSLSLRRLVRDGSGGLRSYDQNVITLGVTATF